MVRGQGGDGNALTVRQLLQHTSGLPEYVDVLVADTAVVSDEVRYQVLCRAHYRTGELGE